jgi:glutathione S-transferase
MITLYDYENSADCYKARLLLGILGLKFDIVPVDIFPGNDHCRPEFLDLNPLAEVPVLTDDGVTLTNATAMMVWLAARYDDSKLWLPGAPETMAMVQQWLVTSARLAASAGGARMALAKTDELDVAPLQAEAHRLLRVIDEHLWFAERSGRFWLVPLSHPTIADLACFPDLALSEEAGIYHIDYPAIRRWLDRVKRIDGFSVMSGVFPASSGRAAAVSITS